MCTYDFFFAGFQNFGLNRGIFREDENALENDQMVGSENEPSEFDEMVGSEHDQSELDELEENEMSRFRYASPYDIPKYVPKPAYKPAAGKNFKKTHDRFTSLMIFFSIVFLKFF